MGQSRRVVVEGGGSNLYRIGEYSGTYTAYKVKVGFFDSEQKIGSARSLEDALSLIKSHSGKQIKSID